ncbi:MAG: 4-fold beta flower protein [Bacteroidota bacterium]
MTKYYDTQGNYKAYTKEDKHLFSDKDEHIGYFQNGFLYDPKGNAIAHVKGKQIIARNGQVMLEQRDSK